ncbi:hypothetical protein G6L37_06235 [Agrobacterium rubi]|nr:hypothetical protein [Agrobacterium rubi]NTF24960.1 hypothetical protein [Agrobacterium rubi]
MSVDVGSIRNRCVVETMDIISDVMRDHDDGGNPDAAKVLLSKDALHHVRMQIGNMVDFRPDRIPQYIAQFPGLLKCQTFGNTLEQEIETALMSEIERPIMTIVREKLLDQHAGQTLEGVLEDLASAAVGFVSDNRFHREREDFHQAWKDLAEYPREHALTRMMTLASNMADMMEEFGTVSFGAGSGHCKRDAAPYVMRLREVHDFLDLTLETEGFDTLLDQSRQSGMIAGNRY